MEKLTPERIRELLTHATPPPWTFSADRQRVTQARHTTRDVWTVPRTVQDTELIAHAPQVYAACLEHMARNAELPELIQHWARAEDALEAADRVLGPFPGYDALVNEARDASGALYALTPYTQKPVSPARNDQKHP